MPDLNNTFIQYSFPDYLDVNQFKGKKIMVVGSGPTVDSRNWENLDYDFIFTCNRFYRNQKLKARKIALVTVISENLLCTNPEFINKLKQDQSLIGVEKGHSFGYLNRNRAKKFMEEFSNKLFYFNTAFQNKAGVGTRLAILALSLQPSDLMLIGIDGHGLLNQTANSFDPALTGNRDNYDPQLLNEHHLEFANYFYKLCHKEGVNLYNLGEGDENNIYTSISSKHYPLPEEVRQIL